MKRVLYGLAILILALVAVGCSSNTDEGSNSDETSNEMITIEHELGSTEVKKNPEDIVVFDFGILDTLDELGIDVVGLPQMNIPSYLDKYASDDYENVGSLKEPDFEKIAEINPELIIISSRQAELMDQFEEIAPTVYLGLDTSRYLDSFKENMGVVAELFDKEEEMEEKRAALDEEIADVVAQAEELNENALIVLANDDKISAYGPSSRFGIIHDVLGVEPADDGIEVSTHGMNVSFEYVADTNPGILYVIDRSAAIGEGEVAKQLIENPLVERTDAYKNDRIYYLDPDFWYLSGGGLQSVSEMIEEIATSLD